ncbi:hypothetical protein A8F94_10835 [Bacillus sp. FJAT-27225]|uniref:glucosaminidase domain-containing protein n=1 Tax=Bacillus sp. FJAT-27225 TaxID=1743144 RepID=UPI00080C21CB|nr:glucosaminidase domain-containing protein [Bacillus sp. FJAT-27225]OCA88285.1 hypothetical protein A8F94_10835 [Bacillus sp. FJAT-27225]
MKKVGILAFLLASFLLLSTNTYAATSGWKLQNNTWYYINSDGSYKKGWMLEGNSWYYFNSTGVMQTDWVLVNNQWYYLASNGVMLKGWQNINGDWYFLNDSGSMHKGWLLDNNTWYYLSDSGRMQTGWLYINNTWYYLLDGGAMKTGWLVLNNQKYYLEQNGAMLTGTRVIGGSPYVFSSGGALVSTNVTGWVDDRGKLYYFDKQGNKVTGLSTINGKTYYFGTDGVAIQGWAAIDGYKYYFKSDWSMHTGWLNYQGTYYYLNPQNGRLHTGWLIEGDKRYYFTSDGKMKTGLVTDGGKAYFLKADGTLQRSWVYQDGKWYYINLDDSFETGWFQYSINDKWYYLDQNGVMKTGWLYVNSTYYYLNSDGSMHTGWLTYNGYKYYLNNGGAMVTGQQYINGKEYHFFSTGELNPGPIVNSTNYNLTLQEMIDIQMGVNPQTDLYKNEKAYVSSTYIIVDPTNPGKGTVNASTLNVREGTSTSDRIVGSLKQGDTVQIVSSLNGWYEIRFTWKLARAVDVAYYVDPKNFTIDEPEYFQFLILSKSAGTSAAELNSKTLMGKGILEGKGQSFINGALKYNVNELYLISHALLETGNGTSQLAKGILVSSVEGEPVTPRVVYNMYGVGARDSCPITCGSEYAYKSGWFTPELAIIGGAEFIGQNYINNATYQQNTLYKMRWNPARPGTHQYASDIGWASKQVFSLSRLYSTLNDYTLYFDVPVFK